MPADQPSPGAGNPALPSTLLTLPHQLPSSTELSPAPQHFASRQAPPLPCCLRAEPKINGCLSDASLDKPQFALKAQVLQKALPPPPPWLAHLCSLKFCRKLCLGHYLSLRISACAFLLAPFCSLTLAGAVLREGNAPIAATSARANDTTSCGDVQTGHLNGECPFRLLGHSAQHR